MSYTYTIQTPLKHDSVTSPSDCTCWASPWLQKRRWSMLLYSHPTTYTKL